MTKKVLSLEAFEELTPEEKMDVLHKDGVHVGKRTIDKQTAILHQLNDFYVEVLYKSYRREIEKISSSRDLEFAQPYLNQVNVRDLDKDK